MRLSSMSRSLAAAALLLVSLAAQAQQHPSAGSGQAFDGARALEYAREFVAIGPRWPTSPGHAKAEAFLRDHFRHDPLEEDAFTANTPIGPVAMRNFIVRFPGKKNGVIVLATHYETNYWLRNINFVGANDGGSTTGLLMAIADRLRAETAHGKLLDGYSVWLLFDDGEEAIQSWSDSDSTYGTLFRRWTSPATPAQERVVGLLALVHAATNAQIRTIVSADLDPAHHSLILTGRPFPTPMDPATWEALQTCRSQREASGTLNPHLITSSVTRSRDTPVHSCYISRLLAPAGTTPSACRQTRIAQLVNDLDIKLTATALGMRDTGLVRYLADNVDRDRLSPLPYLVTSADPGAPGATLHTLT